MSGDGRPSFKALVHFLHLSFEDFQPCCHGVGGGVTGDMDFDIRDFKFEVAKLSDIDFVPVSSSHECVPHQLRMRAVPGSGYPLDGVVSAARSPFFISLPL